MSAPAHAEAPEPFGPDEFAQATNVSRETLARLKTYVGMLEAWNARLNLVSEKSVADVWRRHVWDSAQLAGYIPAASSTLIDLGSGAGFPGLVLAEMLRSKVHVVLVEATGKKCQFLRAVIARLRLDTEVWNSRIEAAPHKRFDVITSRACAPLPKLFAYAHHFVGPGTVCLFLKGQNVAVELTEAHKSWTMKADRYASATDPSGVVLKVRELTPHAA